MQLRHLLRGGLVSITGNIVNVPVDIVPTVTALRRTHDECATIPVKLKRKLSFNPLRLLSTNMRSKFDVLFPVSTNMRSDFDVRIPVSAYMRSVRHPGTGGEHT